MTTLFDENGNIVSYHNLQDKSRWCRDGETMEQAFVREYGQVLGYIMNPVKVTNPYAPDLLSTGTNTLTDLKSQHSPFFKAGELYGIDPTYAVVFNVKDRERYEQQYPLIDILYFVDWVPVSADIFGRMYHVAPFRGIFKTSFQSLLTLLNRSRIHTYKQRMGDTKGNAKDSYVIDIRDTIFERLM